MFGNKHMLHYLCCFCRDSCFSLSHFLGEPSSVYDKKNCVVIIDCFEIFLDRPLNPLAMTQTFSYCKHHNTVKYLIGITPWGTVCFISEGWGC